MARKIKTITLEFPVTLFGENKGVEAYRITKVTDSVEYSPGKCIERKEVDSLCDHPEWKVTIVPNPNK